MLFFETFDQVSVDQELNNLYSDVEVVKVTASKQRPILFAMIKSKRLISFQNIKRMETLLNKQLFSKMNRTITIKPTFELSKQYTLENLYPLYLDSISDELKEKSIVLQNVYLSGKTEISEGKLRISLTDSFLMKEKAKELKDYFERMFQERFDLAVRTEFDFIEPKEKEEESEQERYRRKMLEIHNTRDAEGEPIVNQSEGGQADGNSTHAGTNSTMGEKTGGTKEDAKVANSSTGTANASTSVKPAEKQEFAGIRSKDSGFKDKKDKGFYKKLPSDPSVIYGRNFEGADTPICDIIDEIGEVVIHGKLLTLEIRELRNEKSLLSFAITDFTDTIRGKIFAKNEEVPDITDKLKEGKFYRLKGIAQNDMYDKEVNISSIVGIKTIQDFTSVKKDNSEEKRVELHAHTLMSDMDSVVDPKKLVKRAFSWGHTAVAITDHGVVQAFPDASHALNPKDYKDDEEMMQRAKDFKVIYGMEAYLVDDLKEIVTKPRGQSLDSDFVVFDIETTGFYKTKNKIIEIGAVRVVNGVISEKYSTFVNPQEPIPFEIEQLTSINDEMVLDAPTIDVILPEFLKFCEGSTLVAHNASFDVGFIEYNAEQMGLETDFTVIDTVGLSRALLPHLNRHKLNVVAKELGISLENHHRAVDDAGATAEIFEKFIAMLKAKDYKTIDEIKELEKLSPEAIKKLPSYHAIMLAQNDTGRVNLYRMVSKSHIEYFNKRPKIPKSLFNECREGVLLGSACEAGELYRAILDHRDENEIIKIAQYYDYLEIQPLGNNAFMIKSDKIDISSEEELIENNKKIIALGDELGKLVVATCDVHFMDPEDSVYRSIIMAGKGFKDADEQAPLYFRTTEEMLQEFAYLGSEKAREVVITNTNKISDMIEKISPVRPDKCAPVLENSDQNLRTICYDRAHEIYGPVLPPQVEGRLEHELKSIITNGFAVMYIIAQKLVWKSNEDGYLVGSRGSVGSSFVATMAGITEVNPLPPHYYCKKCHFCDFDSEIVKSYQGKSGCDMPDRECPECGEMLCKDGHEIPFETFLGFNGDKEPDIDLNFSGEYQSKAHDYTEVIFGKGHTFRAGTIGTLAEKTAFGYVKNYYEERGVHKRNVEIERLVQGCVGVRRTTGQHPGGIIVLPLGEEINTFTPVQRPANDMTTKTITTHFDYHSIDHNLLKLDILGHDDPTMIRMLEDITGIDAKTITLDEPKVLSLFANTSALGIKPEDLDGCDLGCLGVPEFGTDFVMQMVRDTKPKTFSDLVRISGLSHGTDVWLNNAQTLIQEGKCTLGTSICTRDDIMTYLIATGVEPGHSFKIMESVRKGKGLTEEMETEMLAAGVPDWYIWSCKRIQYMFPKAHAAAYVMMAFRIAYFKVYYPLAYYAAYFSIRASAFNYELMCLGREKLEMHMADYKKRWNELSKKEQDTYKDFKIVQEMYARGFEFEPINLYTAKAHTFQIVNDKLMPSLSTIDGLGDKAADGVVEAAADGKFLSRDDFRIRSKVSSTVTDTMARLGLFGDLPISNQMSLMDFIS